MSRRPVRQRSATQTDYVDACVFLAIIFQESDGVRWKNYVDTIGYKTHNKGVISHFVLSEIVMNIMEKIKLSDRQRERELQAAIITNALAIITSLYREQRLRVLKLTRRSLDASLVQELQEKAYGLTDDDAFHLVAAIKAKCRRFITKDKYLLEEENLQRWLQQEYNLKITRV